MDKSSILTKAGHDVIKSNVSLQLQEQNQQKSSQTIVNIKSQRSTNRLKEVNDSNEQKNVIQTKYIDENGRYVDLKVNAVEENTSRIITKYNNADKKMVHQPIMEQPDNKEDESFNSSPFIQSSQNSSHSHYNQPIKSLTNNKIPTNNNTLLKNYMKSTKSFQIQLRQLSKMKQNHRMNLRQSRQSYLTNSNGLVEEDFYRVDYNNSGMYNSKRSCGLMNERLSKQTASFFNQESKREFDQIEDILSDIKVLSEKQGKLQYSSGRLFSKGEISLLASPSYKKYTKGGKISDTFSSRKFSSLNNNLKLSKLDQLLQQYQFAGLLSNQFGQKMNSIVNNDGEKERKSGQIQAEVRRKIEKRKMERIQRRKGDRFYQQVRSEIRFGVDFGKRQYPQQLNRQSIVQQQPITSQMSMIRQVDKQSQFQQRMSPQHTQSQLQTTNNNS